MKQTTSGIIGGLFLVLLASCDKKETTTATSPPPKPAETRLKPVAEKKTPAPAPAAELPPVDASAGVASSETPAPAVSAAPATPPAATTPQPTREERRARMTEQVTQRLAGMDKNGDGVISKDELPERMQRRFDAMDTNKDGVVDAAEQKAAAERLAKRTPRRGGDRGAMGNYGGRRSNRGSF